MSLSFTPSQLIAIVEEIRDGLNSPNATRVAKAIEIDRAYIRFQLEFEAYQQRRENVRLSEVRKYRELLLDTVCND